MKSPRIHQLAACLAILSIAAAPLAANPGRPGSVLPPPAPSLLEAAAAAASSGAYRAQNTSTITTGLIREDDRKRSALAFGISGAAAFAGAFLWRWIPCRQSEPGSPDLIGGLAISGYNKCYDSDGNRRGFDTPTKLMLGAGVGLELVALFYLLAHLRQDKEPEPDPAP